MEFYTQLIYNCGVKKENVVKKKLYTCRENKITDYVFRTVSDNIQVHVHICHCSVYNFI